MELRRYRATMMIAIVPNEIGIASIASRERLWADSTAVC
jgi:hypothetical protein